MVIADRQEAVLSRSQLFNAITLAVSNPDDMPVEAFPFELKAMEIAGRTETSGGFFSGSGAGEQPVLIEPNTPAAT
jgi:hypothetical protein